MHGRQQRRESLESSDITITPGVYDGISAKLVESMGFDSAGISGAGLSNSRLGLPDMGFLNLSDNVEMCRMIANAVDIPVGADADTGYGNAVNVYHTVKQFEDAGVASIMLEDQKWPKRCGHMEGKSVIPMDEMCEKLKAANNARMETDPDLLIKARTDAAKTHGIEEVVRRLNAYADVGADVLFADALLSKDDIEYVAKNVDGYYVVNMGYGIKRRPTTPLISPAELEELGVDGAGYPRLITGAAAQGMKNALSTLLESVEKGEVIERPNQLIGWEEYMELIDQDRFKKMEDQYSID